MIELTQSASVATHLDQGEAVHIGNKGAISRITSLHREFHDRKWSASLAGPAGAVIADVRDNRQAGANRKSYQIVPRGMEEGALAFVDRNHRWRAAVGRDFPEMIRGADLVMTYNDDKRQPLQIDISLARPARLFVLMDRRHPRPEWLRAAFKLASTDLVVDEGVGVVHVYEVWEKSVSAGLFSLGANTGESMYGIAVLAEK